MCLIPSLVCRSPDKPSLSIDTDPNKTGNEGLDTEGEWRKKAGNCEHKIVSKLVGNTIDGSAGIPCDFSSDFETEAGKSTRDKEIHPNKHPAFKDEDDVAYVCNNCLGVICQDCRVDYSSNEEDTPTPTKVTFPEFREDSSSTNASIETGSSINTDKETNSSTNTIETSSSTNTNIETSKTDSLLDDYADTSTEMPDYMGGDD